MLNFNYRGIDSVVDFTMDVLRKWKKQRVDGKNIEFK